MNITAEDRIIRKRLEFQNTFPFFSYMSLYLKLVKTDEVDTMAVDNIGNLYYNEKFVLELKDKELSGVLCHEILHLVFEHLNRLGIRDSFLFNIATDIKINQIIDEENHKVENNKYYNLLELPKGCLLPENDRIEIFGKIINNISKKTAESIYDEFPISEGGGENGGSGKTDGKGKLGESKGKYGFDGHIYSDGKNTEKNEEISKQWKDRIVEGITYSRQKGNLPSGLDKYFDDIIQPKFNWKSFIWRYISQNVPFDYTWNKPSKKSYCSNIYFPAVKNENMELTVVFDTSGSTFNKNDMQKVLSEFRGISQAYNNMKINLIMADYKVQAVYELSDFSDEDLSELKFRGGGGSSTIPALNYDLENFTNSHLVIYFTDGFIDYPENHEKNVIWVMIADGGQIPNFGEIIQYE